MRGRQQVYLTIECAPNWPVFTPFPLLSPAGHAHFSRGGLGFSRGGLGCLELCPSVGRNRGHVLWARRTVRDMLIFRGEDWAVWHYVQPLAGPRDMSCARVVDRGACPFFAHLCGQAGGWAGVSRTAQPRSARAACRGRCGEDHVQSSRPVRGISLGRVMQCGTCPFFAGRTGLFGIMSSPGLERGTCPAVRAWTVGHVPRRRPWLGGRGLNWAMPESSGILVSAFDSEATGEFA